MKLSHIILNIYKKITWFFELITSDQWELKQKKKEKCCTKFAQERYSNLYNLIVKNSKNLRVYFLDVIMNLCTELFFFFFSVNNFINYFLIKQGCQINK